MKYKIHLAKVMPFPFDVDPDIERELVGTIEAEDLNDAFRLTQNDFGVEYRTFKRRSTVVGDVFEEENTGDRYMVDTCGFKRL